jgi:putative protease
LIKWKDKEGEIMIKLPELLAPAGGLAQLKAAVENGADAVYVGGLAFNARINAENFDEEDLKRGIEYAHIRGANVYIAMNTLVSDREMDEALEYAAKVYVEGADAIIVQDIGFAKQLQNYIPQMPLHFSTQGTIYNIEGVRAAAALGFKRVVLARELSLIDIKKITENSNTEIEVFVHGSLCISYSGQCQLSNLNGGRSGNRGLCAQPCRLPYKIIKTGTEGKESIEITRSPYILSPKDLCTIENIGDLVSAGVASLKIEGRMKSPEYVAVVTGLYRKYLDMYEEKNLIYNGRVVSENDKKDLAQVFNRGGFTTGYLLKKPGKDILSGEIPKHQGVLIGKVVSSQPDREYINIELSDTLSLGDGIEIRNIDLPGNVVTYMKNKSEKTVIGNIGDTLTVGYIQGAVKPGDEVYKITDKELMKRAQNTYLYKPARKALVDIEFTVKANEFTRLIIRDRDGNITQAASALPPETAINRSLTKEIALEQLNKTGGTPFAVAESKIIIEEGLSVSAAEINKLRREALEKLENIRANKNRQREKPELEQCNSQAKTSSNGGIYETRLSKNSEVESVIINAAIQKKNTINKNLYFYEIGKNSKGDIVNPAFMENIFGADKIYLPYQCFIKEKYEDILSEYTKKGVELVPVIPSITKGYHDEFISENLNTIVDSASSKILCLGNLGWAQNFRDAGLSLFGDYGLNIYNSNSFGLIGDLGFVGGIIGLDASLEQACKMNFHGLVPEWTIFGRTPVMLSEYCALDSVSEKDKNNDDKNNTNNAVKDKDQNKNSTKCNVCLNETYELEDRKDARYPLIPDKTSCKMTLLSHTKKQGTRDVSILKIAGIRDFRFNIYDENVDEIGTLLNQVQV